MKALINESFLRRFNALALPLVIVLSFSTFSSHFLSSMTTEGLASEFEPFFDIFHFGEKFALSDRSGGGSNTKTITTTTLVPDPHRIKAIYRSPSNAFVSISDGKTTLIVPFGGKYKAFTLVALSDSTAIFYGYGKKHTLRLGHDDPLSRQEVVSEVISDPAHPLEKEWHTIKYQMLVDQMGDLQNIGKSIDISPLNSGDKITGFRVDTIAPESVFATFGIMKGDIILSINNKKLSSYADALALYGQLPHLRSIRISLNRNNLQKDIVYEIIR